MTDKIREDFEKWRDEYSCNGDSLLLQGYTAGYKAALSSLEQVAFISSRNGFICKENKNPEHNEPLYRIKTQQDLSLEELSALSQELSPEEYQP